MFSTKNSLIYLAAIHLFIYTTYGKVLEIVNNKPQLKERRKKCLIVNLTFFFHFHKRRYDWNFEQFIQKRISTRILKYSNLSFYRITLCTILENYYKNK